MREITGMYLNVQKIAHRTEKLNPSKPGCMDNVLDLLEVNEIGVAVDFIFQGILNADDHLLIDISLHDLVFLIEVVAQVEVMLLS